MKPQIPNYQAAPYTDPNRDEHILLYNNTGSAISNGAIYEIAFYVAANSDGDPVVYTVPVAPATEAVAVVEVVVVDDPSGSIADSAWGLACKAGPVQALCNGGTDIALGDQLEILNTGTAFTQGVSASAGASGAIQDECAAIALQAYTVSSDATKWVLMLGKQCVVKAS